MIDTVIFDIGNVLVKFDYMPFIHRLLGDEETVTHVNDAIWHSGYWDDLDRGEETDVMLQKMIDLEPDYEKEIRLTFDSVGECMDCYDYAIPWIRELKERGYQVLYLSNYSDYAMKANPGVLDFLPLLDGGIFSCRVHLLKPDPEIYRRICVVYQLKPEECLFIDDTEVNVKAAEAFGMNAIRFTEYPFIKETVDRLLHQQS